MAKNRLLRMDNVGIVVESLDDAISFFTEIGLRLEGRSIIEGEWAGRVTGHRRNGIQANRAWCSTRWGSRSVRGLVSALLHAWNGRASHRTGAATDQ